MYNKFAEIYDKLQDIDYSSFVAYYEKIFSRFDIKPSLVLDIACGTGVIISDYISRGIRKCVAVDISQKMIEIAKDPRFGNTHAFLLFENPQDVLAVVEAGVPLDTVNVGSMAHSTGKVMVNKVLSMDEKDVETFEKLRDLGVKFDVRKVPNDSKANLFDLIKKANIK